MTKLSIQGKKIISIFLPLWWNGRRGRLKICCPLGRGSSSLPGGTNQNSSKDKKMARRCSVTGKGVLVGNNVSHANNKTKRRFLPNLQKATLLSEALGESISLRLTTNGLRTIEHKGGLDAFLLGASNANLDKKTLRFKKRVAIAVDQK